MERQVTVLWINEFFSNIGRRRTVSIATIPHSGFIDFSMFHYSSIMIQRSVTARET